MTNLTLYFEPSLSDNEVYYYAQNLKGSTRSHITSVAEIIDIDSIRQKIESLQLKKATIIIPGEWVLSTVLNIPNKASRKALPYLLEESLASPIEEIHIANSKPVDKEITVYAMDACRVESILKKLSSSGVIASSIFVDYALLPQLENNSSYCEVNDRSLIRNADGTGTCIKTSEFSSYQQLQKNEHANTSLSIENLFSQITHTNPVNLLQGQFKPRHEDQQHQWQKLITTVFAVSLIFCSSYWIVAGWYFNAQANELHTQTKQHYLTLFPETKNVKNIRRQLEGYLKRGGNTAHSDADFMELLSKTSKPLATENSELLNIRYENRQKTLIIEIQSKNIDNVNKLQTALQNSGLKTDVKSANSNDSGVLARLSIALST